MNTYTVRAKRWAKGWELHIEGEGVTQSRTLATASRQATDYIATLHDLDESEIAVTVIPELGELTNTARRVQAAIKDLDLKQRETAEQSRQLVLTLRETGLSGADIAVVMGVSPQRVSQLSHTTPDSSTETSTTTTAFRRQANPAAKKGSRHRESAQVL